MALINFFSEEIDFTLPKPRRTSQWIKDSAKHEKKSLKSINIIFCSDKYLNEINIQYLNHQTFTDIITFDQSEDPSILEGDIFISIERIHDNSVKFNTSFDNELHRVIIHGVLHLIGYTDKKVADKELMRKKEDAYLSLR